MFKGKYGARLDIPVGWEGSNRRTILGGVWIFFGITQFLISMVVQQKWLTVRVLEPGLLEPFWPIRTLFENKDSNLFSDEDLSENMSSFWLVTFNPKLTFWTFGSFTEKWHERNTDMHVEWGGKIAALHVINTVCGCKMCISARNNNRQAVKILRSAAG